VYVIFKSKLPDIKKKVAKEGEEVVEMSKAETKQRLTALFLVFGVVIFFWMAFHQNGLTMSFFARDYTETSVGPGTNLIFNIWSLLAIVIGIFGLSSLLNSASSMKSRIIGAFVALISGGAVYYFYSNNAEVNPISPEIFQHFNPTMIVLLTPIIVGLFAWLNKRNMEPSAPRKIGIGMIIAALGFVILMVGSFGLDMFKDLTPESPRISSYWLISTYFTLTIAELFLSPMGISFVSKVSPPKYQGLMQGGWLMATALGNQMLWIGSYFYERIAIWQVWAIFIVFSILAAAFIFSMMKKLEKVS
jgi:POT family proton-dependent oligopeptide transporter